MVFRINLLEFTVYYQLVAQIIKAMGQNRITVFVDISSKFRLI